MERLVAVGLGVGDPVLEPFGDGLVDVGDQGVHLPAGGLLLGEGDVEHDADREQVVDLLEADLLVADLLVDRVDRLRPPEDPVRVAGGVEQFAQGPQEVGDVALALALGLVELAGDLPVGVGGLYLEAEVLELRLERVQPEAVGEGGVDVGGLRGDFGLLDGRHAPEGAHVVHAVGHLDEDDADVLEQGGDDLAEVLGLEALGGGVGRGVVDRRVELGEPVDESADALPEELLDLGEGDVGVLDDVVEERGDEGGRPEADLPRADRRHGDGVEHVGLARFAALLAVGPHREFVGPPHDAAVLAIDVHLDRPQHRAVGALHGLALGGRSGGREGLGEVDDGGHGWGVKQHYRRPRCEIRTRLSGGNGSVTCMRGSGDGELPSPRVGGSPVPGCLTRLRMWWNW